MNVPLGLIPAQFAPICGLGADLRGTSLVRAWRNPYKPLPRSVGDLGSHL
jgi:hypothetical protein